MSQPEILQSSDELEETADRVAASGSVDLANTLRGLARSWRALEHRLQVAEADNSRLQRQINDAKRTLQAVA
jgi:hypothetical protein